MAPKMIYFTVGGFPEQAVFTGDDTLQDIRGDNDVDVDVEWMYELRQSPLCPPQTYDLHSNDTIKFLVYYSTALRLLVPSNCALKS